MYISLTTALWTKPIDTTAFFPCSLQLQQFMYKSPKPRGERLHEACHANRSYSTGSSRESCLLWGTEGNWLRAAERAALL